MRSCKAKFKNVWSLVFVLLLWLASFVYAMFQGGFVSWFLFTALLPFVLYPFVLSVVPLNKVTVTRTFHRKQYQAGETMEVLLQINIRRFMPVLYLIVKDHIPDQLGRDADGARAILFPLFQKELKHTYRIKHVGRGEHHFQSVVVETGDFLGLYAKRVVLPCQDVRLVYPEFHQVVFRQDEAFYEHGQHASPILNHSETAMVSGVRNYMPGDRLTWIHWKATAKKNELMTKEFEERKSQDSFLILDQAASPHFEELVSLSASLTHIILKEDVGMGYTGTGILPEVLFTGRGEQQKKRIFYQLAKAAEGEDRSVTEYLRNLRNPHAANASYIVVTSSASKELIDVLSYLKGKGSVAVYQIQDSRASMEERQAAAAALQKGIKLYRLKPGSWRHELNRGAV